MNHALIKLLTETPHPVHPLPASGEVAVVAFIMAIMFAVVGVTMIHAARSR